MQDETKKFITERKLEAKTVVHTEGDGNWHLSDLLEAFVSDLHDWGAIQILSESPPMRTQRLSKKIHT